MKKISKRYCIRNHDTFIYGREKSRKCKQCAKEAKEKWRKANPKIVRKRWESWKQVNTNKVKDARLKRLYSISLIQYNSLLYKQQYVCGICKASKYASFRNTLELDHNHKTGKVRGMLCSSCNNILGRAKDSCAILQNAVRYLEKYK